MPLMVFIRLCTKKTCPPRSISLRAASLMTSESNSEMYVLTESRFGGGVLIIERSRRPARDMERVRGMGVAVMESTSSCDFNRRSFSL